MTRRFFLLILTIFSTLLFLLGSCADASSSRAVTDKLQSINGADIVAEVTATYPDHAAEYTLSYSYIKDGDDKITVLSPDSIAGISVTILNGETALEFDGTHLETGKLDNSGLSPLSCLPSLMSAWVGGNVAETANSSHDRADCTLVISRCTENNISLEYRTWFENSSHKPLYAEIYSDGRRVIQCEFERTDYR